MSKSRELDRQALGSWWVGLHKNLVKATNERIHHAKNDKKNFSSDTEAFSSRLSIEAHLIHTLSTVETSLEFNQQYGATGSRR